MRHLRHSEDRRFRVVAGNIEKVRMLNTFDDPHKARCGHVHPRESRTRPRTHDNMKRTESRSEPDEEVAGGSGEHWRIEKIYESEK
jgi:hypothetical protein